MTKYEMVNKLERAEDILEKLSFEDIEYELELIRLIGSVRLELFMKVDNFDTNEDKQNINILTEVL